MRWLRLFFIGAVGIYIGSNAYVADWFPSGWGISLESAYHLSQIALLVIAVLALVYAVEQLRIAQDSNKQTLDLSTATFLLEIDRRWEAELVDCRAEFMVLRKKLMVKVASENLRANDDTKKSLLPVAFADELQKLSEGDPKLYRIIMRYCGFFETVGLLVQEGDISLDYIDKLLRGPISSIRPSFGVHIHNLEKEEGQLPGLYEHALKLSDMVNERIRQESQR